MLCKFQRATLKIFSIEIAHGNPGVYRTAGKYWKTLIDRGPQVQNPSEIHSDSSKRLAALRRLQNGGKIPGKLTAEIAVTHRVYKRD